MENRKSEKPDLPPHSAISIQRSAFSFPKSLHIRSPLDFDVVYAAKTRDTRGPLTIYAKPNDLGHARIGFSISRKVGIAVRRNRIRRLLREAFRLMQHELPGAYDLVIVVRSHKPLSLEEYHNLLSGAAMRLHKTWARRKPVKAVAEIQ